MLLDHREEARGVFLFTKASTTAPSISLSMMALLKGGDLVICVNWSSEARYRRSSIWISVRMRQFLNLRIVAHQIHSRVLAGGLGRFVTRQEESLWIEEILATWQSPGTSTSTGQMTAV
jgi:hypothetical protein